jgi:glycosyltransferase involved in cell wall biosynthesis
MLSWLRGTLAQWVLYRWIMPLSHHVFVQSEQMKRDVMARGIAASRLSPVPMGIARRDVRPARAPDAGKAVSFPAQFLVGYLGTLNRQRRLDMLIDMLSLLRGAGVDARLLVVGGGEEPGDDQLLRQRAVELGVDGHVEITGFMPRTQALERMSSVDVGVSPFFPAPTLRSTSPTKLVEYFALGLPVVANDHPEQRLVLRGSRGGICVPWGARHFAKALRLLADADPEWRRALGERGREWVLGNRTYERIADDVSDVYQRVCAGG